MDAMDHSRIHRDPAIMVGKPCIRGTRITVEHVLREVASGSSLADIALDYQLSPDDIVAAINYAAEAMRREGRIAA